VNQSLQRKVLSMGSLSQHHTSVGEYQLLYEYLHDRYADRLVLTFAQVEDLLGFSLPDPARLDLEWWAADGSASGHSAQSHSWMLAGRTALVNLTAKCVVFERRSSANENR
jgi:hypothetical protein